MTDKQQQVLNKIVDKDYYFAKPAIEISRREAYDMIRNNDTRYWVIWTRRLDGSRYKPNFKNGKYPNSGKIYNYRAKGYWIGYEDTTGNWRTIVLRNVEKFKVGNQMYKIK